MFVIRYILCRPTKYVRLIFKGVGTTLSRYKVSFPGNLYFHNLSFVVCFDSDASETGKRERREQTVNGTVSAL